MTSTPELIGGDTVAQAAELNPTKKELVRVLRLKHGRLGRSGRNVRMRWQFDYFAPAEYYEAVVAKLITPGVSWLDVGCGRSLLPQNPRLARILASRCGLLVGVDPDQTIKENEFVHDRANVPIESFRSDRTFKVVTLHMVAEHLNCPEAAVRNFAKLTCPGAKIVVYTVSRWSLTSMAASLTPVWFHHGLKGVIWRTQTEDTFPVAYRMNTKRRLLQLFRANGFRCVFFRCLPDCCVFWRFRALHFLELASWKCLSAMSLPYPEKCLLGVYERV